jgi:hypothetical protein
MLLLLLLLLYVGQADVFQTSCTPATHPETRPRMMTPYTPPAQTRQASQNDDTIPPRYLRVLLTLDLFLGPGERTRRWILGPANLQTRRHAYARLQEQRVQNTCV